jgi:hypothetical protein
VQKKKSFLQKKNCHAKKIFLQKLFALQVFLFPQFKLFYNFLFSLNFKITKLVKKKIEKILKYNFLTNKNNNKIKKINFI